MFPKKLSLSVFAILLLAGVLSACGAGAGGLVGNAAPEAETLDQEPQLAPRAQGDTAKNSDEDYGMAEEAEEMDMAAEEPVEGMPMPAPTQAALESQDQDAPPPDAMFFEDYGNNPFVVTEQDNLSTFAVDVDTGSYTVARSYLNDGLLPPPEAIRAEEFINYFDYQYPLPDRQDVFGIHVDAAPTPFSAPDNAVMRVGIQGFDVPAGERPDAVLIFVIDVSGSMSGPTRLGAVKEALFTLVNELRADDMVGIVVYGSQGRVVLEPTAVSQGETVKNAIASLESEGSTNAEEGLQLAYNLATAYYDDDKINRIILCSDGVANVGRTGPNAILEVVRQQAREGITLTTVGFGMGNYNDVLMEQLADDGDGQYFYVDTQAEAERVFVDDLTGTLLTIAKDVKIQVEFNPDVVTHYRLVGYENRDVADEDFRNDDVDAGEIGSGHSVTALYELVFAEQSQGDVAVIRLRWEDPETGDVTEIEKAVTTQDIQPSFDDASASFRLAVAAAAFADVLGEGAWAQTADLNVLFELAVSLADELPDNTGVQELPALIKEAMRHKQ